ncbi:MAG: S9 family peptidase, partial [Muriicola sp.]|nr:S9 family peptidase [Muriicola sp.]NNK35268.1 S9 family peptidase [Eudoraea sp.]
MKLRIISSGFFVFFLTLLIPSVGHLQEKLTYQQPPQEILELVDAPLAPRVRMTDNGKHMLLLYRDAYKSIAELSEPEMRLAGLRINPVTNIGSRTNYYNNIMVKSPSERDARQVEGLPENPRLANFSFSPDESMVAVTNTTPQGVEVWVLDLAKAEVKKITEARVNANLGDVINWFKDSSSLLIKMLPDSRKELIDQIQAVPEGPTISTNDGKKAQNRTYQDLLTNPNDEFNFQQLAQSELYKVSLDGSKSLWKPAAMYRNISFSPNGEYVMVVTVEQPFSYLVPYYRFPSTTTIYSKDGDLVNTLLEVPLIEDLPKGFMAERKGMRDLSWRADRDATLIYVEALDEGDPEIEVPFRDAVYMLEAPFHGKVSLVLKTINRFNYISWGNDEIALARDYWWNTRNTKLYVFNPSD